jgi:hypothetical protein
MRSIGGSVGLVLTVIVWTALLPGAILPTYFVPDTLIADAGRGHRIRKTIQLIVMMERTRETETCFTSGQLLIIILHAYNP